MMHNETTTGTWEKFAAPLKAYLVKHTHDAFIAEDLLQEVCLRIHLNSETLRERESTRSWIYTITRNVLMDYFRKNKSREEVSLPDDMELAGEEAKADMHNCIYPFINRLQEPYKSTLTQTELEGIKHRVIAEKEGVSLSAIKTRVQRGREMIRDMFVECCHFNLDQHGKLTGEHRDPSLCSICNPQ